MAPESLSARVSAQGAKAPRKGSARRSIRPKPEPSARLQDGEPRELVILTGLSGSGKLSALKAFEDLGFYSVDNLPLDLIPRFADLVAKSAEITHAALVVDVREGSRLERFPAILAKVRKVLPTRVVFLEASEEVLVRRFSETRRPHPLGRGDRVIASIQTERKRLDPVRNVADILLDTSRFNVHELRAHINAAFSRGVGKSDRNLTISVTSFGFKNGAPSDADLVFDVRFLPNPHFIPEFRNLSGKHPKVAKYVRQFPQTEEFLQKVTEMLTFLLPHYIHEGKSYLTIGIGCTGGQHRSVMIAEELKKRLTAAGYRAKSSHRDIPR
ncbi:MAG: RNase adapter RapZ [Acidobacteriota bacterium]